jgi:hypothetical protein
MDELKIIAEKANPVIKVSRCAASIGKMRHPMLSGS